MTSDLADKPEKFVQCAEGGVQKVGVEETDRKNPTLGEEEAVAIAKLLVRLEEEMGTRRTLSGQWKGVSGRSKNCQRNGRTVIVWLALFPMSMPVPSSGSSQSMDA